MGVITYKCPNCGGGLTFNADIQKYRCEYCLSEFSQEELDEIEKKELEKAEKRAEIQENDVPALSFLSHPVLPVKTQKDSIRTYIS